MNELVDDNRPFVQSIAFGPGAVQICYVERRDADRETTLEKTLTVPPEAVGVELLNEMLDTIHQFLDESLRLHERNPAEQFRSRR
jgi:hypothetical protein